MKRIFMLIFFILLIAGGVVGYKVWYMQQPKYAYEQVKKGAQNKDCSTVLKYLDIDSITGAKGKKTNEQIIKQQEDFCQGVKAGELIDTSENAQLEIVKAKNSAIITEKEGRLQYKATAEKRNGRWVFISISEPAPVIETQ